MQIYYHFHTIKGFKKFSQISYNLLMRTNTANERIRILEFYEKHGLQATLDAFNISKRSLYRYKKIYKQNGALALNPLVLKALEKVNL